MKRIDYQLEERGGKDLSLAFLVWLNKKLNLFLIYESYTLKFEIRKVYKNIKWTLKLTNFT